MRISDWSSDVCSSDLGLVACSTIWRISFVRQIVEHAANPVPHVIGRFIDRSPRRELDRNIGLAILRLGSDGLNAFDPRKPVFEDLGDPAFDDICRGPALGGLPRKYRRAGIGIFRTLELVKGEI